MFQGGQETFFFPEPACFFCRDISISFLLRKNSASPTFSRHFMAFCGILANVFQLYLSKILRFSGALKIIVNTKMIPGVHPDGPIGGLPGEGGTLLSRSQRPRVFRRTGASGPPTQGWPATPNPPPQPPTGPSRTALPPPPAACPGSAALRRGGGLLRGGQCSPPLSGPVSRSLCP